MTWERLPALPGRNNPCLCCPPIPAEFPADGVIAVGFGMASLTRDGSIVWKERGQEYDEYMTGAQAEVLAAADPDHDWRIVMFGPLHGESYQRQDGHWFLVERNEGFA